MDYIAVPKNPYMKVTPLFILSIFIFALSCKKNNSSNKDGSSSTPQVIPLLTKYVQDFQDIGADSVVYALTYDNNKRIVNFTSTNNINPYYLITSVQVVRDSAGIMTEAITSYPNTGLPTLYPSDTLIFYYDNSTSHYTAILENIWDYSVTQDNQRDSTVVVYDNTGKISEEILYLLRNIATSTEYTEISTEIFEYDQADNVVTDSVIAYDYGTPNPNSVFHYQYDSHPNPVSIGNEALLLPDRSWELVPPPMSGWFSKNNIINGTATYINYPGLNVSYQRVFYYTSTGLPSTSTDQWVNLENLPQTSGATRYYYQ